MTLKRARSVLRLLRRRAVGLLALSVLLNGCSWTGGDTAVSGSDMAKLAAGELFVATVPRDHGNVDLIDVPTGQIVEKLLAGKHGRATVTGLSIVESSRLLVTYDAGPHCTSGAAGCGPEPRTCGGEVDEITLATGAVKLLWRVDKDTKLAAATLSPIGTQLAALTSPCVPSYFNAHITVRSLVDGRAWSIGGGLPRCHRMTGLAWTADGRSLLTVYAAALGTRSYTGSDGICSSIGDASLVQVSAEHPQDGLTGEVVASPHGCTYQAVAVAGAAVWALQVCGRLTGRDDGQLSLARLDTRLRTTRSWTLGTCDDGDGVLTARSDGQVLVEAYHDCSSDGVEPVSTLSKLSGTAVSHFAPVPGGGTAYEFLTW